MAGPSKCNLLSPLSSPSPSPSPTRRTEITRSPLPEKRARGAWSVEQNTDTLYLASHDLCFRAGTGSGLRPAPGTALFQKDGVLK